MRLATSTEELAVRTHANQLQNLRIGLAIDQQQVGFEVAFAMVAPVTGQPVVAVLLRQSLVFSQKGNDVGNDGVNVAPMLSPLLPLEVATKRFGVLNPPHSSRPSGQRRYSTSAYRPCALPALRLRWQRWELLLRRTGPSRLPRCLPGRSLRRRQTIPWRPGSSQPDS